MEPPTPNLHPLRLLLLLLSPLHIITPAERWVSFSLSFFQSWFRINMVVWFLWICRKSILGFFFLLNFWWIGIAGSLLIKEHHFLYYYFFVVVADRWSWFGGFCVFNLCRYVSFESLFSGLFVDFFFLIVSILVCVGTVFSWGYIVMGQWWKFQKPNFKNK